MDDVLGAPAVIETPVSTETPVSAPVTAPVVAPVAPVEPVSTEPKSRADTIREALNKPPSQRGRHAAYQPREGGKFAPGQPAVPSEATPADIPLPKSLKREYEPHWKLTAPELRQAIVQREADYEKGATTWKAQAEQGAAILEQFKPYEWILRNEGATPQTAIAPLLQTAAILRTGTPAQKAQAVAVTMRQFGIPIEHIQAMLGGAPQNAVMDPQYNQLAQQVQQLTQAQQQQEQQNTQRAVSVIEQFAADPANQHFQTLQPQMLALLQSPDLLGQDVRFMSEREKLKLAYDTALRLDPTISTQVAAQQQADAQTKARTQAQGAVNTARAAAVQVRGAPGAAAVATVNSNDRRAVIANALRQAQT